MKFPILIKWFALRHCPSFYNPIFAWKHTHANTCYMRLEEDKGLRCAGNGHLIASYWCKYIRGNRTSLDLQWDLLRWACSLPCWPPSSTPSRHTYYTHTPPPFTRPAHCLWGLIGAMFSIVSRLNGCRGLHCETEWGQECSLGESLNKAFWRLGTESRGLPGTSGVGETACSTPPLSSFPIFYAILSPASLLLCCCLLLSTAWRLALKGSGYVCWNNSLCPGLENEL